MGRRERLLAKLKSKARDFTFDDAQTLLGYFGYQCSTKGKTSGSRVCFTAEGLPPILLHKPHPRKELLDYQMKQLAETLEKEGLL